ncbi:MAG: hypothetical protein M1826_005256 [Phylliscum demangeonii]|nr:MAG: hypothetical protein M1826_005256 [Phylliscum demangeonii]
MAKQVREDHERDLIRRIGTHFRLELRGLDGLLDKQKRPTAYKCMRGCIITEFEKRFSADPNGYFRSALGFAYVICQKKDRCNLDHDDRINPYNYKKVVPSSAQGAERQDRNVNEFELLTGRASNAVHRFAAHAGKTWNAAFAQGQRLKKAALSQEGELEKAWAKDKVLQLVRHEG